MPKKSQAGTKRQAGEKRETGISSNDTSQSDSRQAGGLEGETRNQNTSAGDSPGGENGTAADSKATAPSETSPQQVPSNGKDDGTASGVSRGVDRRALRRILTWLLETNTEQQSLILSAMDIVSDSLEGSAEPADRSTSPGELLRAILADRASNILHPPPRTKK
jgi:hypothetical protein